ncbi:MAG: hypothetical protein ACRCTE_13890 [Cellulosilyticaceae bacterium]
MRPISELFSVYIVVVMLAIGLYLAWNQSRYLKSVDHLIPESHFVRIVGIGYVILSIVGGGILLWG